MQLKDIMAVGAVTIGAGASISEAARLMRHQNVGMLVVTGADSIDGVVTDRDLLVGCVGEGHSADDCEVAQHMSRPVIFEESRMDALDAARLMRQRGIKRMPVTEYGKLVGVVSFSDIVQALEQPLHDVLLGAGSPRRVTTPVLVGRVSHYFTHLGVAALTLESPLHRFDQIHFVGRTTDFTQQVESMEIEHEGIEVAYAGDDIGIKVDERVRVGDSVYVEAGYGIPPV